MNDLPAGERAFAGNGNGNGVHPEHLAAVEAITPAPCPACGEELGGRHAHAGRLLCWPCYERAVESADPSAPPEAIAGALAASRVDLLELIRSGVPDREFIVGMAGALVRGKRHHIAGEAKAGKTLTVALVAAIDIVAAGGTVVILDRENGQEEYARRLGLLLDARGASDVIRDTVARNYRYHAWPELKLEWGKDPAYAAAFEGADVVIFDSSRKFLTAVGLKEDGSDDWATFTDALIDPLMLAGVAVVVLDNTGHGDKDRARGTSSKADLCDVMFSLKAAEKFSRDRAGRVEMTCTHSRIGELDGVWTLELGGGSYGAWEKKTAPEIKRKAFADAVVAVLGEQAPLGRDALIGAARAHDGVAGKTDVLRQWLSDMLAEPVPQVVHQEAVGYVLNPDPGPGVKGGQGVLGDLTPGGSLRAAGVNPDPSGGVRPRCSCVDGGDDPTEDGRCSRCYGVLG